MVADGRAVLGMMGAVSGEIDDVHVVELARQRGFNRGESRQA